MFMPHTSNNDLPARSGIRKRPLLFCSGRSGYCISALVIGAFLGGSAFAPGIAAASPDQAQTQAIQPVLPSFSALVERVAPAVVSIRVKANPAAMTTRDDDEDSSESSEKGSRKEGTPNAPSMAPMRQGRASISPEKTPASLLPSKARGPASSFRPMAISSPTTMSSMAQSRSRSSLRAAKSCRPGSLAPIPAPTWPC